MSMKPYRVIEVLTLRSPTILALSDKGQFAARKAALKATDTPGVFEILTEAQFKKGELIGLPGDLPKGMDRFLEPADGPPRQAEAAVDLAERVRVLEGALAAAVGGEVKAVQDLAAVTLERDAMAAFLTDDQKAAVALTVAEAKETAEAAGSDAPLQAPPRKPAKAR